MGGFINYMYVSSIYDSHEYYITTVLPRHVTFYTKPRFRAQQQADTAIIHVASKFNGNARRFWKSDRWTEWIVSLTKKFKFNHPIIACWNPPTVWIMHDLHHRMRQRAKQSQLLPTGNIARICHPSRLGSCLPTRLSSVASQMTALTPRTPWSTANTRNSVTLRALSWEPETWTALLDVNMVKWCIYAIR